MTEKEFGGVIVSPGCISSCYFCNPAKRTPDNELKEQEIDVYKNLLDFKKQGIRKIEISGSDPIEYDRIIQLMNYIKKMGFEFLQLSTHGRKLFDENFLNHLVSSGLDKLRIPIYGSKAEIHDAVTGAKGSFYETLDGIKKLLSKNIKIQIQISSLITQENKNDLINMVDLMKGLGITDFYLSVPLVSNNDYSHHVPFKDLKSYVRKVYDYAKRINYPLYYLEVPYCIFGEFDKSINNSSLPPDLGKHCQPPEHFKTDVKDLPSYRIKKKVEICNDCKCFNFCDGFFVNDISKYGIEGIEPIKEIPIGSGNGLVKKKIYKDETQNLINVGKKCNCDCISCPNERDEVEDEVPFEVISERIERMNPDLNIAVLTGGEPTIRKDFFEILKKIRNKLPNQEITILTNGKMFSDFDFARETINHNVRPTITIYGTEEIHDFITQVKGSYTQTIEGIKNLIKIGKSFSVITIFNKTNFKDIKEVVEELIKIDRGKQLIKFYFQATEYIGEPAMKNREMLHISVIEMAPYINEVVGFVKSKNYNFSVFFPLCILKNLLLVGIPKIKTKEDQRYYCGQKCEECFLKDNCNTIWSSYIDYEGEGEIKSVTKDDIQQWTDELLEKELKRIYKKNKMDFISLLRFFYGDKKCGRVTLTIEETALLAKIMSLKGYHKVVIPRGLTKSANSADKDLDSFVVLKQLSSDNFFNELNRKEGFFEMNQEFIKSRISYNLKCNSYHFLEGGMNYYNKHKYYLVFGKDEESFVKLLRNEILGESNSGISFGYPSCCVDAYRGTDYPYEIVKKEEKQDFSYLINFFSMFSCPLFEHTPCKLTCNGTIETAKKTLDILKNFDEEIYREVVSNLKRKIWVSEKFVIVFNKKLELNGISEKEINKDLFEVWPNILNISELEIKDNFITLKDINGNVISKNEGKLLNFL